FFLGISGFSGLFAVQLSYVVTTENGCFSISSVLMKSTVYYTEQLLWLIILDLRVKELFCMKDLLEISCGLDVHKEKIVACILTGPLVKPTRSEIREFTT